MTILLSCNTHAQEPNIRYLALENLTRLALVPEVLESIREHQVRAVATVPTAHVALGCCTA